MPRRRARLKAFILKIWRKTQKMVGLFTVFGNVSKLKVKNGTLRRPRENFVRHGSAPTSGSLVPHFEERTKLNTICGLSRKRLTADRAHAECRDGGNLQGDGQV